MKPFFGPNLKFISRKSIEDLEDASDFVQTAVKVSSFLADKILPYNILLSYLGGVY